jgi:hypothetical protein
MHQTPNTINILDTLDLLTASKTLTERVKFLALIPAVPAFVCPPLMVTK